MSHFTVFVIGDNIEQQLAPYHEFECTGMDDQYVQDVDVTEEAKEKGLDWFGLEEKTITSFDEVDLKDKHTYGYALVDTEGNVLKAVNRTNPNRKWDWYVVGGRWSSWLQAKTGAKADSLRKGEIDFASMRKESADKAAAQYDKAFTARGGQDWITWDHMRGVLHKGDIDAARTAYHEQPALKTLRAVKDFEFMWTGYDEFLQPRDQFIQHAHDSSVTPFAVLLNGAWHERGSMGWWGAVSDEQDANTWNRKVTELLDNLSDDTLITVVDCHI